MEMEVLIIIVVENAINQNIQKVECQYICNWREGIFVLPVWQINEITYFIPLNLTSLTNNNPCVIDIQSAPQMQDLGAVVNSTPSWFWFIEDLVSWTKAVSLPLQLLYMYLWAWQEWTQLTLARLPVSKCGDCNQERWRKFSQTAIPSFWNQRQINDKHRLIRKLRQTHQKMTLTVIFSKI